jgi:hypothetical protein
VHVIDELKKFNGSDYRGWRVIPAQDYQFYLMLTVAVLDLNKISMQLNQNNEILLESRINSLLKNVKNHLNGDFCFTTECYTTSKFSPIHH